MKSQTMAGKVVLVTGSSMGIGKAIANEFAQAGAKVILNDKEKPMFYRTEKEFLQSGYDVFAVTADIRFSIQCKYLIRKAIEHFGKIDILINNAGVSSRGSLEDMHTRIIKIVIDTNYTGTAYLSKYAIPYLKETRGNLVFINSVGGLRGMPYNSAYTASKAAQTALAEALRIELYDSGVHVGIVYVGYTENDARKKILDADGHWIYLPKRTNLRLATRESVASQVFSMVSSRSPKITLTPLGSFTAFMIKYLPKFSEWLLRVNREVINREYTAIGGERVSSYKTETVVEESLSID